MFVGLWSIGDAAHTVTSSPSGTANISAATSFGASGSNFGCDSLAFFGNCAGFSVYT